MSKYLYNGTPLPNINSVWTNKETHPHAVISMLDSSTYALYIAESYEYSDYLDSTGYLYLVLNNYVRYTCVSGTQAWEGELALSQVTFLLKRTDSGNTSIPVWASFNIEYAGTLYLSATDPIPVGTPITDPLSFAMGWQLGQRLRMRGKKPIGYLYNGVRLPKIPEVDGYAVIVYVSYPFTDSGYWLCVTEAEITVTATGVTNAFRTAPVQYKRSGDSWIESKMATTATGTIRWSNYDVHTTDGDIWLEKSDPVPVYE